MPKDEIVATLHQCAPALKRLGVARAVLFGSRARGDETDSSDIDVAVFSLPGMTLGPCEMLSIYGVLGDAFGYNVAIDVVAMPCRDPVLNAAIERDAELAFA